ncbi:hypothetical protein OIU77_026394 [Salix suchowensis]|uniref:Bulb-type lectin domain-containing protein n=1 Tax=Salix suchowensis TaxID=1278906 RepID=A0ABQ9BMU9_9ROSI|nr:hypothetical protein OIU77_026394 [Salix suchowensis]
MSQIHIMNLQLPYCFCFFLLLQLPFSTNGQAYTNVSLGSSLTTVGDLPAWTSPSGEFAFGFQQVGDAGYLLAIWFNKIPERTIVWSANRNNLAQRGSTVQLTADGQLVLNNQSGTRIWTRPELGGSGAAYGAMLDTGNFVLAGQAGANLWQSFDEPTDTLLPTQNLNLGGELIAPYLEKNYSDGRFKLILQDDGNLVMHTTAYPLTTSIFAYWTTQSSIGSGHQLIFNQSGNMYVVATNGTILNPVFSNSVPSQDLYLRATIDYDGVFRQYVYPKTASGGKRWAMNWTTLPNSIPSNICLAISYSAGSGACGFNSYCTLGDDQRPSCRCPPGYTFSDHDDDRKGCKKTFISQDCDHPSQEIDSFEIRDMPNTNFPYADYEVFSPVDEDWCRQSCLSDCYCDVAIFIDGKCWKKRGPLLNGVTDPSLRDKALMKVRIANWTAGSSAKKRDPSALIVTGSVLLGSSIFLIVLSLLGIYVFFTRWNRQKRKVIPQHHVIRDMNLQNFTYNELETATGGFDEELGRGAFGPVYKGTEQSKTTTAIRGTKGYVAPEWFKNLPVTTKVDTYSFGILLLELVCCRKNFEINAREEHQTVLADWACDCFKEGKLNLLVEEDEEAMEDMKRVERFVMVAIWCIQEDPSLRPAMKKVVQMLEGGVQVSVPPDPSSFISSI